MRYEIPEIEVINFGKKDIVTLSGDGEGTGGSVSGGGLLPGLTPGSGAGSGNEHEW